MIAISNVGRDAGLDGARASSMRTMIQDAGGV